MNIAYPVTEAARKIGISRSKIYELMDEKRIAYCMVGSRRLIEHSALEAFMAECRVSG